jgi:serine/threonine-protein kinase
MPTTLQVGEAIGSYRIVRLLGEGGMGAVYEAAHQQIGRRAAAKILTLDPRKYPNLYHRFVNEARAANQIKHPGVVQVFEFGQLADGTPWMLMEYLEGHTLGAYLRAAWKATGRHLGTDGLWIFYELATILTIAHDSGIVHRDLKPGNVMIVHEHEAGGGERVKLLDFGIAKFLRDTLNVDDPSQHFTATGAMLGTPIYMAPEQCKSSAHVTGQADVYALGVMIYEMYTGQPPFADPQPLAVMAQKIAEPALPLSVVAPGTPAEIVHLVQQMLDRDPAARPDMAQVQARLGVFLNIPATRRSGFLHQITPPPPEKEQKPSGGPTLSQPDPGPSSAPASVLSQPLSNLETQPPVPSPFAQRGAASEGTPASPLQATPRAAGMTPELSPEHLAALPLHQQPTDPLSRAPGGRGPWLAVALVGVLLVAAALLWLALNKDKGRDKGATSAADTASPALADRAGAASSRAPAPRGELRLV